MKRVILMGVLLFALAMALSPMTSAFSTYTDSQRETVTVTGGYMVYHYAAGAVTNYDINTTLPWAIGDLHQNFTQLAFHFTGYVNLTGGYWNERVIGAGAYTPGTYVNETLYNSMNQGGGNDLNGADTWSHINLTMDSTLWTVDVYYYLTDTALMNSLITYTETDNANPSVDGLWSVTDSLEFGTLPFTMTLYLDIAYPGSVVSGSPDLTPWDGSTATTGTIKTIDYQKFGPAHTLKKSAVTAGTNSVTIDFKSADRLKKATWNIDFADEVWNGAFAGITSPTVTVNGDRMDAADVTLNTGSLALDNVEIDNDDNTVVIAWAAPSAPVTPATTPTPTTQPITPQTEFGGVPIWAIGAIIVVVIIAAVAIMKVEEK